MILGVHLVDCWLWPADLGDAHVSERLARRFPDPDGRRCRIDVYDGPDRDAGGTIGLSIAAAVLNNSLKNELASDGVFSDAQRAAILADPTVIRASSLGLSPSQKTTALVAYSTSLFATVFCVKGQKTLKRADDERLQAEGRAWAKEHRDR